MRSEGYSTWVCVSVCLSAKTYLTSRISNQAINEHAYLRQNVKKLVGVCLKRLRLRVMPRTQAKKPIANLPTYPAVSFLHSTHAETSEVSYPGIVNDIMPCPKRCLLMLLAHVGARTDSTTRGATTQGVANFRARALAYYAQYGADGFAL